MQTGIPECWTSFLEEVTPALSKLSIDIGVIGVQGKATETRKNCNIDQKERNKNTLSNHIWKKKFYVNSTEMYMTFACLLK